MTLIINNKPVGSGSFVLLIVKNYRVITEMQNKFEMSDYCAVIGCYTYGFLVCCRG